MHPGPLKFIKTNPRNAHAALGGGAKPAASRSAGTGTFPSAKASSMESRALIWGLLSSAARCPVILCHQTPPELGEHQPAISCAAAAGNFAAYARSYSASFILYQNPTATAAAQAIPSKPSRKQAAARCTLTKPNPTAILH